MSSTAEVRAGSTGLSDSSGGQQRTLAHNFRASARDALHREIT